MNIRLLIVVLTGVALAACGVHDDDHDHHHHDHAEHEHVQPQASPTAEALFREIRSRTECVPPSTIGLRRSHLPEWILLRATIIRDGSTT
jgi:hypothetical protein